MAKTATRTEPHPAPAEQSAPESPQTLDDRTPIDDLEAKKKKRKPRPKRESLPDGYKRRLPAGKERVVTVVKDEIGKEGGFPLRVTDVETGAAIDTTALRIEGESEAVGNLDVCTGRPGIGLKTRGSILVGRSRPA
jgi:hypothetical protein